MILKWVKEFATGKKTVTMPIWVEKKVIFLLLVNLGNKAMTRTTQRVTTIVETVSNEA
jgi:hypothetical protein